MGFGEVGEQLRRSTVQVRSADSRGQGIGSGVVWSSDGTIVTNAHVAAAGEFRVELWDGSSFPAKVAERDPVRDLAILKIRASGLPAATFRFSPMRAGEIVIAAGNPLGFTGALSTGVAHASGAIGGLGRGQWVQAAVRLAPGNSGGPLADASGAVVGINTMVVSGGLALAIPAVSVAEFIRNGCAPRLGVALRPVRLESNRFGLLIMEVETASAAERSSLFAGDILLGTKDAAFRDAGDLGDAIAAAGSGCLTLRFLRGDRARERRATVSFTEARRAAA
ncbi:MAG TPA: trypsin-like peptidase domain-containing protein [Bryobacteraceae bacterium]|jgi:serine protease Do